MTDLGARAAARELGCSHTYLLRLAREGRIPRNTNGSFDIDAVRAALASITDPGQVRHSRPDRWSLGGDQPVTAPGPVTIPDDARAAVMLVARVLAEEGVEVDGPVTIGQARTAETILKTRERDLKLAERRRELVPLAAVRVHVEKAFIGYRQAVQRLPSRCASQLAAELGCDAARLEAGLSAVIAAMLAELSAPVVPDRSGTR